MRYGWRRPHKLVSSWRPVHGLELLEERSQRHPSGPAEHPRGTAFVSGFGKHREGLAVVAATSEHEAAHATLGRTVVGSVQQREARCVSCVLEGTSYQVEYFAGLSLRSLRGHEAAHVLEKKTTRL